MLQTVLADGEPLPLRPGDRAGFTSHRFEMGIFAGDYGGANYVSAYTSLSFNSQLAVEAAVGQFLGRYSNGVTADIGLTHVLMPEWRWSPFLMLGIGVVHIEPKATLVQPRTAPSRRRTWAAASATTSRGASSCAPNTRLMSCSRSGIEIEGGRMETRVRVLLLTAALCAAAVARLRHGASLARAPCRGAGSQGRGARRGCTGEPIGGQRQCPARRDPTAGRAAKDRRCRRSAARISSSARITACCRSRTSAPIPSYGLDLAYHMTEDLFFQAEAGRSTGGLTSFETLSGSLHLLTEAERQLHVLRSRTRLQLPPGRGLLRSQPRHDELLLSSRRRRAPPISPVTRSSR